MLKREKEPRRTLKRIMALVKKVVPIEYSTGQKWKLGPLLTMPSTTSPILLSFSLSRADPLSSILSRQELNAKVLCCVCCALGPGERSERTWVGTRAYWEYLLAGSHRRFQMRLRDELYGCAGHPRRPGCAQYAACLSVSRPLARLFCTQCCLHILVTLTTPARTA